MWLGLADPDGRLYIDAIAVLVGDVAAGGVTRTQLGAVRVQETGGVTVYQNGLPLSPTGQLMTTPLGVVNNSYGGLGVTILGKVATNPGAFDPGDTFHAGLRFDPTGRVYTTLATPP